MCGGGSNCSRGVEAGSGTNKLLFASPAAGILLLFSCFCVARPKLDPKSSKLASVLNFRSLLYKRTRQHLNSRSLDWTSPSRRMYRPPERRLRVSSLTSASSAVQVGSKHTSTTAHKPTEQTTPRGDGMSWSDENHEKDQASRPTEPIHRVGRRSHERCQVRSILSSST